MIKYVPKLTSVVMEEIPDRVTLAVEISNCRGNCAGCHSPFLKQDIGLELTPEIITALVGDNFGVNCFLFLGEGQDPEALLRLARHVHTLGLQAAVYSGRSEVEEVFWDVFDYIKLGPYEAARGPLNEPTTNQRLYRRLAPGEVPPLGYDVVYHGSALPEVAPASPDAASAPSIGPDAFLDITPRFWRRGVETH